MALKKDIEQIEKYLLQNLSPQEQTAFEATIKDDPTLARDVAAYQQLLSGFSGIRAQNLGEKLQQWSADWEATDEVELIEWYLSGQLSPALTKILDKKAASNGDFAEKVEQYRKLQSGMSGLKQQSFAEKLQQWEDDIQDSTSNIQGSSTTQNPKPKTVHLWPRLAIAASFLLLVGLGLRWYAQGNFSNDNLYAAYYDAPKNEGTLGDDSPTLSTIAAAYQNAHQNLQAGDPELARQQFQQLLQQIPTANLDVYNQTYYQENTEWSIVMTMLKTNANEQQLFDALQPITDNTSHSFHQEALALKNDLGSFWHTIGN